MRYELSDHEWIVIQPMRILVCEGLASKNSKLLETLVTREGFEPSTPGL